MHLDLPVGWESPDPNRARQLKAQFLTELEPDHPLHKLPFEVVGVHSGQDTVVVCTSDPDLSFQAMHLSWARNETQTPHEVERLADLPLIFEPPADSVDEVTLWTDGETEKGLVLVQHLLNGDQLVTCLDWPYGLSIPKTARDLEGAGWRQVRGPLNPRAPLDGAMVPTGQTVEYWVRPIVDDFMLFRVVATPGEALSLRQLIPPKPDVIEFDTEDQFRLYLPRGFACRFVSPVYPGYGLSGFNDLDRSHTPSSD
ncbi:hypothetical protein [Oricola indica]|uniref:hypothetical protein n=1 Tax=Oricola indica TaxID=2872591 RepID=UPI001CBFA493|nr:hypothetical protein [Oricola indica]